MSQRRFLSLHSWKPCRPADSLSTREREIVALVAQGLPNKQIAAALNISQWTVGSHLRVLYARFGVTSRAVLVASALKDETSR